MISWDDIISAELGKRFQFNGRSEDAYDCWGLVLRVYRALDRPFPGDWTADMEGPRTAIKIISREVSGGDWQRVEHPEFGDIAGLSTHARIHHVGVVTPLGILHTTEKHGVVVASPAKLRAIGYKILGYFRWAA